MSDFDQAPCQKVNITEMHFPSDTYLRYYPSSLGPSVTPICYLLRLFPPVRSLKPLPISPCSHPHPLPHPRPPPPPSIHTTASLLIICDLLKYILCHSLSLSLPLSSASLAHSLPGLLFTNITHFLSLSLPLRFSRCTLSRFCLSVLRDKSCRLLPAPLPHAAPPLLYRREVTNMHREPEHFGVTEPVGGWNLCTLGGGAPFRKQLCKPARGSAPC